MVEVTTAEAARRLGVSQERVGQMLRAGDLSGRRLSARTWLVELGSVSDRGRSSTLGGRPWSDERIRAVITALSSSEGGDARTAASIVATDTDILWRRISQAITIQRFRARRVDLARRHLVLTGESALDVLSEQLVGDSRVLHGYLSGIELNDLIDDAGLVEDPEGDLTIHQLRSGEQSWIRGEYAPRALVAVDCARSAVSRVHAIGVRGLDEMRIAWLAQNT